MFSVTTLIFICSSPRSEAQNPNSSVVSPSEDRMVPFYAFRALRASVTPRLGLHSMLNPTGST
jgi:hypothetical protein